MNKGRREEGRRPARRSSGPSTLALNRRLRDPNPSSGAGLRPCWSRRAGMLGRSCTGPPAPQAGGCLREEDEKGPAAPVRTPKRSVPMQLIKVDPRALKENPDRMRQTKSTPQADALLLATIKAVGIVQPPVITPETGGGNGYVINAGHRRVKQAIAAGLEEIDVLVDEAANDNGAMRSMVENIAREALNPVDQWRAIERLVALGGPRRRSASPSRCRCVRSGSCACWRTCFPPCSTTWPRATCRTSSSSVPWPQPRWTRRRKSGRSTSRRRPIRRSRGGVSHKRCRRPACTRVTRASATTLRRPTGSRGRGPVCSG